MSRCPVWRMPLRFGKEGQELTGLPFRLDPAVAHYFPIVEDEWFGEYVLVDYSIPIRVVWSPREDDPIMITTHRVLADNASVDNTAVVISTPEVLDAVGCKVHPLPREGLWLLYRFDYSARCEYAVLMAADEEAYYLIDAAQLFKPRPRMRWKTIKIPEEWKPRSK